MKIKQYHWGILSLFFTVISILLLWLYQHSVNAYWQQTYHVPSLLHKLDDYVLWRKGGELKAWIAGESLAEETTSLPSELTQEPEVSSTAAIQSERKTTRAAFGEPFIQGALVRLGYELDSKPIVQSSNSTINSFEQAVHSDEKFTKLAQNSTSVKKNAEVIQNEPSNEPLISVTDEPVQENLTAEMIQQHSSPIEPLTQNNEDTTQNIELPKTEDTSSEIPPTYPDKIRLGKQDMVFFAGDSLMQGVAPYVQQWLTENAIKSINLSKQSTGLSYPKFFNWPATIEETLQKNPEIRLLVVFLGPNDPWDFPHPEKPKSKYLRFKEAEWESVYRQRISHILDSARKLNVNVIWLQIPHMRAPKLNTQMAYLNEVLETETHNRALFIPIKAVLSGGKNEYRESILIDGKEMRVRSKDGIHFTPSGMKLIAKQIIQHIELHP